MDEFETRSVRMERRILVSMQTPIEDVDRIMDEVVRITPLAMGSYDCNSYQSGPGTERYRSLDGAAAGAENDLRRRPGVVDVSFELPDDQSLLDQIVETIFQTHSYQEPVIRLSRVLASRSKGLDDSGNPNRWWNTTGDWTPSVSSDAADGS